MEGLPAKSADTTENMIKEDNLEDLYKKLESQENDLVLAAELGKALLDKNEEISKDRESIVVEYLQKLEVLEQEKYHLRRKMEVLEEEYQQQVVELHADIASVKKALEKQARKRKNIESQSSETIREMTEDNQRLTLLVKQSGEKERQLVSRKNSINTQFVVKKTNMQEHFNNMEDLNKQISDISQAKAALEDQIEAVMKEITSMTKAVEHSANKIRQMIRKTKSQENSLSNYEGECEKLKSTNQFLLARLEKVSSSEGSVISRPENLLIEINSLDPEHKEVSFGHEMLIENNCAGIEIVVDEEPYEVEKEIEDLREEVFSVYQQTRNMCASLMRGKGRKDLTQSMQTSFGSSGSSEDPQSIKVSQLNILLVELQDLMMKMVTKKCGKESGTCGDWKMELEVELHRTKESVEHAELRLKQVEQQSKQEIDKLQDIKCKLSLASTCLAAAEEEKEILTQDLQNLTLTKEMMIKKAWETRDAAVESKNAAEVDLARNRIEMMQVSSQLMEAVQQKVTLSEKLEDMEVNMVSYLQNQVKIKLNSETSSDSESGKETLSRKISRKIFRK